ncbi:alpha-L-fucosidase-like [Leptopilina heterotoma]|uniref:alpha-L-fucosidase-like n=1 Tax=Leptopilina heterotoma TaxID=63436 RepID=UPI001CA97466|nr:alpha-L-fucosidase-like [Leptopilina heterotoma]XP_043461302.1 alpha-L-fucosidase-like [Leptopilina heterotoma]
MILRYLFALSSIFLFFDSSLANQISYDHSKKFEPNWDSLDKRALPTWYDDAKFGIFIHWGVFSVPSFGSEWFWYNWKAGNPLYTDFMKKRYHPNFSYQDFAKDFTAEFFNATQWSEIFQASGAKYVILTSKHHEGYTLWPSKYSFSWNAKDVGPQRDLISELSKAIRSKTNLTFGLYHSLYEWFNPLYLEDKKNKFTTNSFVTQKIIPELNELVDLYKPEVIWSDGDWEAPDTYWESKEFLSWLYNYSPVKETVVVNDRWGRDIPCHHGDFYTCTDRYDPGVLQAHKWENCMTIDRKSWGFRRNADLKDYMSVKELIRELVITVSCNGNLLMNVGPTKEGIISPIFEERLREMGHWLSTNGEAIYKTKPWNVQNDTLSGDVWYTQSKDGTKLYAILLSWPKNNNLGLSAINIPALTPINLLGYPYELTWEQRSNYVLIDLPVEAHKGNPAWVVVINTYL